MGPFQGVGETFPKTKTRNTQSLKLNHLFTLIVTCDNTAVCDLILRSLYINVRVRLVASLLTKAARTSTEIYKARVATDFSKPQLKVCFRL